MATYLSNLISNEEYKKTWILRGWTQGGVCNAEDDTAS